MESLLAPPSVPPLDRRNSPPPLPILPFLCCLPSVACGAGQVCLSRQVASFPNSLSCASFAAYLRFLSRRHTSPRTTLLCYRHFATPHLRARTTCLPLLAIALCRATFLPLLSPFPARILSHWRTHRLPHFSHRYTRCHAPSFSCHAPPLLSRTSASLHHPHCLPASGHLHTMLLLPQLPTSLACPPAIWIGSLTIALFCLRSSL